ncbi:SMP-30/gluconolactonase/LRE family protein [Microvirga sp. Mcv34]|uniref:SMP-30/gluconolactonase/LRE family protein n=1 Tax=Microvirga sp. Mcv34 TaxID=2926016 RepID=UPI0021C6924B|nr:SMP-30/gluconolactonase/LRE family protein [Microvirga sp. Mcv34]
MDGTQLDPVVIEDQRFKQLVSPGTLLRKLFSGLGWAEGPIWLPDRRALLCSDIPGNRIVMWREGEGMTVWRDPSDRANGNTLDAEGRLVTCEHQTRRVTRTEHDGTLTVLATHFDGKRFNSPNDVVVRSDGMIFFSDPHYGFRSKSYKIDGEREMDVQNLYRLDPATGEIVAVGDGFFMPNGLAFSCDESILVVADSGVNAFPLDGPRHVRQFRCNEHGDLDEIGLAITIEPGVPDGLRVDEMDNYWISAADGVHCYTPAGERLGKVLVPETVANLTFGGNTGRTLFIAATTSVYAIDLKVAGTALASPRRSWRGVD